MRIFYGMVAIFPLPQALYLSKLFPLFKGILSIFIICASLIGHLLPLRCFSQKVSDTAIAEIDLQMLLFPKKRNLPDTDNTIPYRKLTIAPLPVIGYNPANGLVVGGALSAAKLLGDPTTTRQSSGLLNLTVTSKRQLVFISRLGIAFPDNDWLFEGDFRYLIFNQDTYGLGTRIGAQGTPDFASPQPMDFNYIRIYGNGFRRLKGNLYGGFGVAFDIHNRIQDKLLDLESSPPQTTYHYDYSAENGFPNDRYATNGFLLHLRWDSRDNIANPYKGWYASIVSRINTTWLGSEKSTAGLSIDGRYYVNLVKRRPMHLIAFWLRGDFFREGTMPFLALPSIGWDAYNRTGRGYVQGRFRGHSMAYFETEYRFPLMANGLLGGVLFSNFSSTAGNGQVLLNTIAPAGGVGLRIKLDQRARTNITIDYGWGAAGSTGLFFNLQEAF
jgi:outer membrane protein assembly factor BamA